MLQLLTGTVGSAPLQHRFFRTHGCLFLPVDLGLTVGHPSVIVGDQTWVVVDIVVGNTVGIMVDIIVSIIVGNMIIGTVVRKVLGLTCGSRMW